MARSLPNLRGSQSSPTLGRSWPGRSPFEEAQTLCSVHVTKRRAVREAVHGSGSVRVVSDKRLRFAAFERGVEWEKAAAKAPKYLPPLEEVLRSVVEDFGLDFNNRWKDPNEQPKRPVAFGGSTPKKLGPRLPLRRPRLEELAASQTLESQQLQPAAAQHEDASRMQEETQREKGPDGEGAEAAAEQQRPESAAHGEAVEAVPSELPERMASLSAEEKEKEDEKKAAEAIEDELPFPWSEDDLRGVFAKFDTDCDGEINTDELPTMMRYLGARAQPGDCETIIKEQTSYATLSFDEFLYFLDAFRRLDVSRLRHVFKEADENGNNVLDYKEVFSLLHKLNYAPTHQSCIEAMEAADLDKNGTVDFREFEKLVEHLRKTEGMTKNDVEELRTLYNRCTTLSDNSTREPVAEEIWHITVFLGYSATQEEIQKISSEVDADGSEQVSFDELLKIVRTVRDMERTNMARVIKKFGDDELMLPIENLGIALNELGYYVAEESVFEILDSLGALEDEDNLNLEELAAFLRHYRQTEGFTNADMKELEDVFNQNARPETMALRTLEVGRVLRWFGFSRTVQEVQNLVEQIDFDCSGELELNEFVKLMRRMHQDEAKQRFGLFDSLVNQNTGEIPVKKLPYAVGVMEGVEPDAEQVKTALMRTAEELGLGGFTEKKGKKKGKKKNDKDESQKLQEVQFLDRTGFEAFFRHFRQLAVEEVHKNVGYSAAEVKQFRDIFQAYDKDGGGTIAKNELIAVLSEYFPESTKSKEGQKDIERAIKEIDSDGNCELDFAEFLRLMRMCDDQRDASDLAKEIEVVKDCGFSPEEVEGFRQIFSAHVNWAGELSLESVIEIMGQIMEFRDDAEDELRAYLTRVSERQNVRFPGFLRLLKRITEDNILNINHESNRVIAQAEKSKQKAAKAAAAAAAT